jgi:hypothetical protein
MWFAALNHIKMVRNPPIDLFGPSGEALNLNLFQAPSLIRNGHTGSIFYCGKPGSNTASAIVLLSQNESQTDMFHRKVSQS